MKLFAHFPFLLEILRILLFLSQGWKQMCSSRPMFPYLSVDAYPIVFIHCGISGTHRTLNKSVEHYPQCNNCSGQPNVHRRKRKTVVQNDLNRNNKGTNKLLIFVMTLSAALSIWSVLIIYKLDIEIDFHIIRPYGSILGFTHFFCKQVSLL